jgi:Serine hydrolase (FSH1)
MRRLRILGLHGYHGSGAVLRRQLAPLAERLDDIAEFETPDAPSLAAGDFGWWHGTFPGSRRPFSGWPLTVAWLESLSFTEFDGVLGFSQGAALAGLLAGLRDDLGFAIPIGGFVSPEPDHRSLYQSLSRSRVPSLHLVGNTDSIVEPAESTRLAELFTDPVVTRHPGGHVIPSGPIVVDDVRRFLERFQPKGDEDD